MQIKKAEFDYLIPVNCYKQPFVQYEKEIVELKDELLNQHDQLYEQEQKSLSQLDQLENNFENIGWITSLAVLQQQLLQFSLKQEEVLQVNFNWINNANKLPCCDNQEFIDFKANINKLLTQFDDFIGKFEDSESNYSDNTNSNFVSQQLFDNLVSSEALIKQLKSKITYSDQITIIQTNILNLFRQDWRRREAQGDIFQNIAKANTHDQVNQNSQLYSKIRDLQQQIDQLKQNKVLNIKLLKESIQSLQLPDKETKVSFTLPENIKIIQSLQIKKDEPQLHQNINFTAEQEIIKQIQNFAFDITFTQSLKIDEQQLSAFNTILESSIKQYQNLVDLLEKGLIDENIACDALEESCAFTCPKIDFPQSKPVQTVEINKIKFDQSILSKFQTQLENCQEQIQNLSTVLENNNQDQISAQLHQQTTQISSSLDHFISKVQKALTQVKDEINLQKTQITEQNTLLAQKRQDLSKINCVSSAEQSQIFILQKQNFCQICKTTPLGIILPCGHCFCDRCLKDQTGRNCKCPTCRQMYKETEVVKMRKGLNFK